ncbi:6-phosphogluconate dehydrogenase [Aspergillus desertorum]
MALNLSRRFPSTVWNRTVSKWISLSQAGARVAETHRDLAENADVIFTMLKRSGEKILINTSSVSVTFSHPLAEEGRKAGAHFIEMPLSSSRSPAEQGELFEAVYRGAIGCGLKTKYAVNLYLITMTAGLTELMALARAQGLDVEAFVQVLDAGPMASPYSKLKTAKMMSRNYEPQAAVKDCYKLTQLVLEAAKNADAQTPFVELCASLCQRATAHQLGDRNMIALKNTRQFYG